MFEEAKSNNQVKLNTQPLSIKVVIIVMWVWPTLTHLNLNNNSLTQFTFTQLIALNNILLKIHLNTLGADVADRDDRSSHLVSLRL